MLTLFFRKFRKRQRVACLNCGAETVVKVIHRIDSEAGVTELLEGRVNVGCCAVCAGVVRVRAPLLVRLPGRDDLLIQYLPSGMLWDPGLEPLLNANRHIRLVASMAGLVRLIGELRGIPGHMTESRASHRRIAIPEAVVNRIQGTYKKAKLKTLWFVWTQLEEGAEYSQEELDGSCRSALACLDETGGFREGSDLRVALCELGFLHRSSQRRTYWKATDCANRSPGGRAGRFLTGGSAGKINFLALTPTSRPV